MTVAPVFQARAYAGAADLVRLARFLLEVAGTRPPHTYWHRGSLLWSICFHTAAELRRDVQLWEDGHGELQGFAWFEEPNSVDLLVHPRYRGQAVIEPPMLLWAAERARAAAKQADGELWTIEAPSDTQYIACLTALGFTEGPTYTARLVRQLDGVVPEPQLPAGWRVRPISGPEEWEERVDVHREVWHPSRFTLDIYHHLRSLPGYNPDLDIVAVAPDGTIAAYCLCWLDPRNQIGLLEPVGTRAAYRRRGLGTAVLYRGMRQLQAKGARSVWVSTGAQSSHALAFYQSVGFHLARTDHKFVKVLSTS